MSNFISSGPRSRALLVLAQAALVSASMGTQVPFSCGVKGPDETTWEDVATGRIVNGQDATECEWKWQAALVRRSDGYHFCGGTLISDRWVLTAAHCMIGYSFDIVLGSFKRNEVDSNEFQVGVKQVISHPSYNDESWDYDFALVELQSSAPIGACIDVACLPEEDIAQGDDCMITGWGTLKSGGSFPNKMQEAMVQIVGHDDCDARMARTVTDRMVCGQGELSNGDVTDACHGDSGGPLVCRNAEGAYTLHGAASWGYGCASPSTPGVWARVFAVRGWIDQQIGATQSATPATATPPLAGGMLAQCFMPGGTDSAGCAKVDSGKFSYYEMSLDESSPSEWTLMFRAKFWSLKNHRCAVGFGKECLAKGRHLKSTACRSGSGWNDWAVLVAGGKGRLYCNGQIIHEVGYPAGLSVPQKCAFIVGGSSKNNQCSKIITGAKLAVRSMVLHQGNALLSPELASLAAGASAR